MDTSTLCGWKRVSFPIVAEDPGSVDVRHPVDRTFLRGHSRPLGGLLSISKIWGTKGVSSRTRVTRVLPGGTPDRKTRVVPVQRLYLSC